MAAVLVTVSNPHMNGYTLTALVQSDGAAAWWMMGVYVPLLKEDRVEFLQELVDIRDLLAGPWLLAGDFNLLAREEDKNNSRVNWGMIAGLEPN